VVVSLVGAGVPVDIVLEWLSELLRRPRPELSEAVKREKLEPE